jgi:hypothetical protein
VSIYVILLSWSSSWLLELDDVRLIAAFVGWLDVRLPSFQLGGGERYHRQEQQQRDAECRYRRPVARHGCDAGNMRNDERARGAQ